MTGLFYEEIDIGLVIEMGSYHFTRDRILDFAQKFDPQRFHVDDAAAREGPFGALTASGLHTASAWMKSHVASNEKARAAVLAAGKPLPAIGPSPGINNLRWSAPVYVDDIIDYRSTVTEKKLSSRAGWGLVLSVNEGFNQHGKQVLSFEGAGFTACRSA